MKTKTIGRREALSVMGAAGAALHVAGLRKKLEPNPRVPQYFLTMHGLGYKFVG